MVDLSKLNDWAKFAEMMQEVQEATEKARPRIADPTKALDLLRARIKGQDHFLEDLVARLPLVLAERAPNKPAASLLLLGGAGTGKTVLAKALAELLFADDGAFLRFDGSELGGPGGKARLLGLPHPYIGDDRPGELTRPVRERRARLIAFIGLDMADSTAVDVVLQVLREGQLIERTYGHTADFTQCVMVFTTNAIGSEVLEVAATTSNFEEVARAARRSLGDAKILPPELVDLVDLTYVFRPPDVRVLTEIALLRISALATAIGLTVGYIAPELIVQILSSGNGSRQLGARELDRRVNDLLCEPLAAARASGGRAVRLGVKADGAVEITLVSD